MTFSLTPQRPEIPEWGLSAVNPSFSEQNSMFEESLRRLEKQHGMKIMLDPVYTGNTIWPTDLLKIISNASFQLASILRRKTSIPITREWLTFWEIYSLSVLPELTSQLHKKNTDSADRSAARAKQRNETAKSIAVKAIVKSFIIRDDDLEATSALNRVILRAGAASGVSVTWDWLVTSGSNPTAAQLITISKDASRWVRPIEDTITSAVVRSWKNKINTSLKNPDIIVINRVPPGDVVNAIFAGLMSIGPGGTVIASLHEITGSLAACIHVFMQCFSKIELIYASADDKMFLCGMGYNSMLVSKHHKIIMQYCESLHCNQTPFTHEYLSGSFMQTVDMLLNINLTIQQHRYEFYDKILTINEHLQTSTGAKLFAGHTQEYLAGQYKDLSPGWIKATQFNFFE